MNVIRWRDYNYIVYQKFTRIDNNFSRKKKIYNLKYKIHSRSDCEIKCQSKIDVTLTDPVTFSLMSYILLL